MRQRRQSAAGTRKHAPARDGNSLGTWRRSGSSHPPITYRKPSARLNRWHRWNRARVLARRCFDFTVASYACPAFARSAAGLTRDNFCRAARSSKRCDLRTRPGNANYALGFDSRFARTRHRHWRRWHSSLEFAQSSRYRADRRFAFAPHRLGPVFKIISQRTTNRSGISHRKSSYC